jgi:hypothetical protein
VRTSRTCTVESLETRRLLATIAFSVFSDLNANGVRDANEKPLGGNFVDAGPGTGGWHDSSNQSIYVAKPGTYSLRTSPVGAQRGASITTPKTAVVPSDDSHVQLGWVGVYHPPAKITGRVIDDVSWTGDQHHPSNRPLAGVEVVLTRFNDSVPDVRVLKTDANGWYEYTTYNVEEYQVVVKPPAGYLYAAMFSSGHPNPSLVVRADWMTDADGLFAVMFEKAKYTGIVFHDLDADGVRDPGEPGIESWLYN